MNKRKLKKTTALFLALMMILSMVPGATIVAHAEANTVSSAGGPHDYRVETTCTTHFDTCDYNDTPSAYPKVNFSTRVSRSPDYLDGYADKEGDGSNLGGYEGFAYDGTNTGGGYPLYSGIGQPFEVVLDVRATFLDMDSGEEVEGRTVFKWKDEDGLNYQYAMDAIAKLGYTEVEITSYEYNIYAVTLPKPGDENPKPVVARCPECTAITPRDVSGHHAGVFLFCIEPVIVFSAKDESGNDVNGVKSIIDRANVGPGPLPNQHNTSAMAYTFTTSEIVTSFDKDLSFILALTADVAVTLEYEKPIIEGFDDIVAVAGSDEAEDALDATAGIMVKSGFSGTPFVNYGGNYNGTVVLSGDVDIDTPGTYIQTITATDENDGTVTTATRTVTILPKPELEVSPFSIGKNEGELTPERAIQYANINAKDSEGIPIPPEKIEVSQKDLEAINEALATAKPGETYPVEFKIKGTDVTYIVDVMIKDYGNAAAAGQDHITANNFYLGKTEDTLTEARAKYYASAGATDSDGKPIEREDIIVDSAELAEIKAKFKEANTGDVFQLTFKTSDGAECTVNVEIRDYGNTANEGEYHITANDFSLGLDSDKELTDEQAKIWSQVSATDENGNPVKFEDISVDANELSRINDLINARETDTCDLTFSIVKDGEAIDVTITVDVTLHDRETGDDTLRLSANDFTYAVEAGTLTAEDIIRLSGVKAYEQHRPLPDSEIGVEIDGPGYTLEELNNAILDGNLGERFVTLFVMIDGNAIELDILITLTALYTLVFDTNEGSSIDNKVAVNDSIIDLSEYVTTRDGFTFEGWYSDADLEYPIEEIKLTSEETTIYAKWTHDDYTLIFDTGDGDDMTSIIRPSHTKIDLSGYVPTYDGYTFAGWYSDEDFNDPINEVTLATAETTVYAKWTHDDYTLIFDTGDGDDMTSIIRPSHTEIDLSGYVPTYDGYTFVGWCRDSDLENQIGEITLATAETTIYAKWTRDDYVLRFETNGGSVIASEQHPSNTLVNLKVDGRVPTRDGYTFVGWYSDAVLENPINEITLISKETTVYAKWTVTRYTLTYDTNGGTAIPSETYNANERVTLNKVPTRAGYTFGGWYIIVDGKEVPVTTVVMTSNITVYAKWVSIGDPGTPSILDGERHYAYVIGYPDGTFRPNNQISRAEAATIFFRLLQDNVRDGNLRTENPFSDVSRGNWYNTAVSTMTGLGILTGYPNGAFIGEGNITRAEFAVICARFSDENPSGGAIFTDISGHWAEQYIKKAAALGWINGYSDGTFRPDEYITRAEAVTLINRMLNRLPRTKDDLHVNMVEFSDNLNPNMWYYLAVQEASNSHKYVKYENGFESWTDVVENPDWSRYE